MFGADTSEPTSALNSKPMSPSKPLKKPPARKGAKGAEYSGGLSKDFESFDILWFDIQTRTRQLVAELCQPIVDKVHTQTDELEQMQRKTKVEAGKLNDVENIVYDREKKLDVFE